MITLKNARENKGITQEELAKKAEITLRYYAKVEKGESIPSVTKAIKICKILEVSVYDIEEWSQADD